MFPLHDENRPSKKPYMNYILIIVNVVIFFFFYLGGRSSLINAIETLGAVPSYIIQGKRLETLLTSMFMHADIMHILGNMLYLWVFGDNIEDALGHSKYLIFYLLGGFAATFAHIASVLYTLPSLEYYWGVASLMTPSVGASGAISAVLGSYLLLYPRARIRTLVILIFIQIVRIPAYYYLGFWFLYQLMMGMTSLTGISSGVAFWAHIGGFVAGLLLIKPFGAKVKPRRATAQREKPVKPLYVSQYIRRPFADVLIEDDKVRVIAELPGVEMEDIDLKVSSSEIVISAEHGNIRYQRRVVLPTMVVPKVEEISYHNGVLAFSLYRRM